MLQIQYLLKKKKKSNTFFTSTYLTKNCIICMKELWFCSPISHIGVANY